jgi:benzoyl-CoA reductase/2-hydroxyglutaryl-CoA dehydratase subunit BcrC/BadD/HgdB
MEIPQMTSKNVIRTEENGETVLTYKGRSLYEGLTTEQEAFVRVIEKELGEIVACSVSCVLAGETKQLVCVTDLQLSLIRDYARMHEFVLPPSLQHKQ